MNGGKRAVWIAHRRAGKESLALHYAACAAIQRRGSYVHCLPSQIQARKAVWQAVNPHSGIRYVREAFPTDIVARECDRDMFLEFTNGSTWQCVGSDSYDALACSPPIGVVLSEYALCDPTAWTYYAPMVRENDGWALFTTTPRGRNHASALYDMACDTPTWFAQMSPATETSVFTPEHLEREKQELIQEFGEDQGTAHFNQDYMCSFKPVRAH